MITSCYNPDMATDSGRVLPFGEALQLRRRAMRLRQQDLADALEYGQSTISNWEGSRDAPRDRWAMGIVADLLHCSVEDLERGYVPAVLPTPENSRNFQALHTTSERPEGQYSAQVAARLAEEFLGEDLLDRLIKDAALSMSAEEARRHAENWLKMNARQREAFLNLIAVYAESAGQQPQPGPSDIEPSDESRDTSSG